jgi:hypothetical protein
MKRLIAVALTAVLASSVTFAGTASAGPRDNTGPGAKSVHTDAAGVSGWAVIDPDGTLARKLNAKSVLHVDTGIYAVSFNSNIRHCAYTATVGLSGSVGSSLPGYATVVALNEDTKGVYLKTFDSTGALADLGSHLLVSC